MTKMNYMSRFPTLPSLVVILTLVACQTPATTMPVPTSLSTATQLPTTTPLPTATVLPTSTPNPFPDPTLKVMGEEEIVFDWSKDRCGTLDIPDLPARAFHDDQGNVQLIAAHYVNYRFIGSDLNSIKRDCQPIMQSASIADPSKFSYHQWIGSTYTEDGKTIYALIHNEYYGSNAYVPCLQGGVACWYNAITLAVSTDSGASYHAAAAPPDNLVASAPYLFEAGAGPYGFFNPSNIIKDKDGYYYAYMREHFYRKGDTGAGICVMRTKDLSDASSWRAWDGKDFTVSFINPYLKPDEAKSAPGCVLIPAEPGLGVMNESVTFNTYLNRYVMVGFTADHINGREVWGVFYSFSNDLVHWQPRKLLQEVKAPWTYKPGDPDYYEYPSLVDPDSPSRNFDITGKHAYVYLTRFNKTSSQDPLNRDLVRIPVEFFPSEIEASLDTNGKAWEFDKGGDTESWNAMNQLSDLKVSEGHLQTNSLGRDPYMGSPQFAIDAQLFHTVTINMKVTKAVEGIAQLFFGTVADNNYTEAKSLRFPIQADGEFHTYSLDMSQVQGWTGIIKQLRFDPTDTQATIEIDYIRITGP
jgi:hypothetical protein